MALFVWWWLAAECGRCPVSVATTTKNKVWTLDAVQQLGMTCDVPTAGEILGISRSLSYRMIQDGTFPVRALRLCRSVRVSVPDLLTYLGAPLAPTTHPNLTS
jgi:hypothetical protein